MTDRERSAYLHLLSCLAAVGAATILWLWITPGGLAVGLAEEWRLAHWKPAEKMEGWITFYTEPKDSEASFYIESDPSDEHRPPMAEVKPTETYPPITIDHIYTVYALQERRTCTGYELNYESRGREADEFPTQQMWDRINAVKALSRRQRERVVAPLMKVLLDGMGNSSTCAKFDPLLRVTVQGREVLRVDDPD